MSASEPVEDQLHNLTTIQYTVVVEVIVAVVVVVAGEYAQTGLFQN